jgi:hypothetical protein
VTLRATDAPTKSQNLLFPRPHPSRWQGDPLGIQCPANRYPPAIPRSMLGVSKNIDMMGFDMFLLTTTAKVRGTKRKVNNAGRDLWPGVRLSEVGMTAKRFEKRASSRRKVNEH